MLAPSRSLDEILACVRLAAGLRRPGSFLKRGAPCSAAHAIHDGDRKLAVKNHLSANRKLALRTRTLFASAQMPRAPESASACFGASAGILAAGPVGTILQLICGLRYELSCGKTTRRRLISPRSLGRVVSGGNLSEHYPLPGLIQGERVGAL